MSCPNYTHNQCGFPLYINNLEDEFYTDEIAVYSLVEDIESDFNILNEELKYFKLSVNGGHYYGLQFDVDYELEPPCELLTEEESRMTEEELFEWYGYNPFEYEYGCKTKEEAITEYNDERDSIERILDDMAEMYGFDRVVWHTTFSNGEAIYQTESMLKNRKVV